MSQKLNTGNTPTPYDDVHRTLLNNCTHLIIPVVNEAFHKHYGYSEKVTLFQNEFFYTADDGKQKRRSTDSHFAIGDIRYHLECQSTPDGTILFRIFEYDSQMALQDSEWNDEELTVNFPNTALIFLRHTKNTPNFMRMKIHVPNDSCYYEVPILKVQNYDLNAIFEKRLYFLLPFHLFTYEHNFAEYNSDAEKLEELKAHYVQLIEQLDACVDRKLLTSYDKRSIVSMMKKVMEYLTDKFSNVKEGLGDVMFGKILDYEAHDILMQGREEGEIAKLVELIMKKLANGQSVPKIAEDLMEDVETIQHLIDKYTKRG